MIDPALPRELQIEVTGSCNLRCQMCLVRYRPGLDRHTASLDLAMFKRIVDTLPELEKVTLQGLGEPLMAPDLIPMVAHASARGIRTGFNTNGALLTRKVAESLLDAGLAWLHVSVDGATPATYESIRDGARLATVERHVRGLVALMGERGAVLPSLSLVFVAMRRNVSELPAMVRLAADWGVSRLRVQNLSHSFGDTDGQAEYADIRAFAAAEALWQDPDPLTAATFAEARALADALGVELRLPEVEPTPAPRAPGTPGCDWPWSSAYVRWDGRVQPCCMLMGETRGILGDVRDGGLAGVWRGPGYEKFRAALLGDEPPEVCKGCSMYRGVF